MKIKNYRLLILSFVTVSFVLLTGFDKSSVNTLLPSEKPAASNELKEVQPKSQDNLVKSKKKRIKNKQKAIPVPTAQNEAPELQKPLDLSMPFKESESASLTTESNRANRKESLNIFASEKKKMPRRLDLNGQMLMSQEPEGDKQKSLDGAGIVINLKR